MLHVEKRCVTVRTSNPSDGEALGELLDLTGPVSGIYLQILKELLKKHHNNVTYARNMFFRSLFLQTRPGKIPFRMSELYGKSQRKVVSVANPMLKQTNGVENKGNYMSWLELNLIANIATYLPLEDFFSFIQCDKVTCKVLKFDSIWETMCRAFFASMPAAFALPASYSSWKSLLKECIMKIRYFVCPHCNYGSHSIVPVVYGFPTAELVRLMKDGKVFLGGDHIIPGCSVYICNRKECKMAWSNWPYHSFPSWHDSKHTEHNKGSKQTQSQLARYVYT